MPMMIYLVKISGDVTACNKYPIHALLKNYSTKRIQAVQAGIPFSMLLPVTLTHTSKCY